MTQSNLSPEYQEVHAVLAGNPEIGETGNQIIELAFDFINKEEARLGRQLTHTEAMAIIYSEHRAVERGMEPVVLLGIMSHIIATLWGRSR